MAATLQATIDPGLGRPLLVWADATVGDTITRDGQPLRGGTITATSGSMVDAGAMSGATHTYALSGATATITVPVGNTVLVHPKDATLNQTVKVRDDNPNEWEAPGTVHEIIGLRDPIVTHTVRSRHRGTFVFWTPYAQRQAIIDLFADGSPILINPPDDCPLEFEWTWGRLVADKIDVTGGSGIWWTYDYQRVAEPASLPGQPPSGDNTWLGVVVEPSENTWSQLVANHPTWVDVMQTAHPHPAATP
jgi:hypothetical protein